MNSKELKKLINEKLGKRLTSLSRTEPGTDYPGQPPETSIPTQGHEYMTKRPQRDKGGQFGKKLTTKERYKLKRHRARKGSRDDERTSGYVEISQSSQERGWASQQARAARHKAKQGVKKVKGAKPSEEEVKAHRKVKRTAAYIRRQQKPGWESPHITQMRKLGKLKSS